MILKKVLPKRNIFFAATPFGQLVISSIHTKSALYSPLVSNELIDRIGVFVTKSIIILILYTKDSLPFLLSLHPISFSYTKGKPLT
jgi:hypothetical protein